MAICVKNLDSTILYAFLQIWGEAMTLKLNYEGFILAVHGFWWVIICNEGISYVCGVKITLHDSTVQAMSTGLEGLGKMLGEHCHVFHLIIQKQL